VVLVPGPPEEITVVRRIYADFIERPWTRSTVRQVLTNEKYIGNNVWNRRSFKLKTKRVQNDPALWVRADGVFESIIDPKLFNAAQKIVATRSHRPDNEEMLNALQRVLQRHGYLPG